MKSLKKYSVGIILSLFEVFIGILLLIDPVSFTSGIIMALGAALILYGAARVIKYFRADPVSASVGQLLVKGLAALIAGVYFLVQTDRIVDIFPALAVLYGLVILIVGLCKVQRTVDMLRLKIKGWSFAAVSALLSVVFAVVILANPFETVKVLWSFTGITLIVESAFDITAMIASGLKNRVSDVEDRKEA